jgi:CubicO group peptidase (beta-lactamase class C family)
MTLTLLAGCAESLAGAPSSGTSSQITTSTTADVTMPSVRTTTSVAPTSQAASTPAVATTVTEPSTTPKVSAPTTGASTLPPSTEVPVTVAPTFSSASAAFDVLAAGNLAASLTIVLDGVPVLQRATGRTIGGDVLTTDTPLVIASVSKLITALSVARLSEQGVLDITSPVPWTDMGLAHDAGWDDVTVRELLWHTSGMPIARRTWLDQPGSCATPLQQALAAPPSTRGTWTYSNGNYCALGLLIEHATGRRIDEIAAEQIFDPLGVQGPHLTVDGARLTDGPYEKGIARFDRLGGAGTWMASTDDLAAMLGSLRPGDADVLAWPGIIVDQYGWGHTGTVDGAKACAWVMQGGRTIVVAVVAGAHPASGGGVCDEVIPAVATDLDLWAGEPVRTPD